MSEPRRYLCERCGGTGQQPDGVWNCLTMRYDAPAGVCDTCGGSGRLGVIETAADVMVACEEKTRTSLGAIAKQDVISSAELDRLRRNSERWELLLRANPATVLAIAWRYPEACKHTDPAAAVDAAIAAEKAGK